MLEILIESGDFLKLLDKLLKYLKTDRNTFFTYILTLISIYIIIDRVVEMIIMIFTGIAVDYWSPLGYTFAMACPVFAFLFSFSSKYASDKSAKHKIFDVFIVSFYIVVVSMFVQWMNLTGWMLFLSVPAFSDIVTNFYSLIRPAFSAVALYIPLTTFYGVIKWLITGVNDSKDMSDSIEDYGGISLADKSASWGAFTCELKFGTDDEKGKTVKIAEEKRFYPTLIAGVSGSGKTSMLFEPMIAQDIDKKYFFKEISKEMGFTALKTGLATLLCPYTNEYINENFNLNMLAPIENKIGTYNTYMKKLIIANNGNNYIYKNLGITYMTSDIESINHIKKVLKAYKLKYNLLDPMDENSIGLNPFIYDDPIQTAIAISTVLRGTSVGSISHDAEFTFLENTSRQIIENLVILLKEIYPRLNDNDLPTLEDLFDCLNDFSKVKVLCEELKQDKVLARRHSSVITYLERYFYPESSHNDDLQKYVRFVSTQLEEFLRYPNLRNVLCNRVNNINFDKALKNGEITLICTRRGDLGQNTHIAFGLFAILLMQHSVLRRTGDEKTRIPHFLYIDEFSDFVCDSTDSLFTLYRKYKVSTVVSVQNLAQLDGADKKHRQIITSNCSNKFVFGNNSPEDNDWWSIEIGNKKEWDFGNSYDTAKGAYDPKLTGIKYADKTKYKPGKIQALKFKQCIYKLRNLGGKSDTGIVDLNFLSASYYESKKVKQYQFDKFNLSSGSHIKEDEDNSPKTRKQNLSKYHFDEEDSAVEIDPIKTDTSDSKFLFDNEDAIVINLKKNK